MQFMMLILCSLSRSGSPSSRPSPSVSPRPPADKPEEKNDEAKRGNALLQVTEAHLATLSDEDGDTYVKYLLVLFEYYPHIHRPLHLAIIHENLELTKYLVKLIVGVYMNLDIANNMRQVSSESYFYRVQSSNPAMSFFSLYRPHCIWQ